MKKFPWGKVVDKFAYDFDGDNVEITKYHPWKTDGCHVQMGYPDKSKIEYHCQELHESSVNIHELIISWIARKNLGLNQHSLVAGVCLALGVK